MLGGGHGQGVEFLARSLDGGGELLGGYGVGALNLDGLGLVIGIGIGHAGHVEQRGLDSSVAVAAHKAGSLDCVTHGCTPYRLSLSDSLVVNRVILKAR